MTQQFRSSALSTFGELITSYNDEAGRVVLNDGTKWVYWDSSRNFACIHRPGVDWLDEIEVRNAKNPHPDCRAVLLRL